MKSPNFDFIYKEVEHRIRGEEIYWERLTRISASPHNRILRTDHKSRHHTVYILSLLTPDARLLFHPVECRTLSAMEVINKDNHECFACRDLKGKIRGLLHAN